jgi:branched-chain amino acid transport system substrate-binding protein
MSITRRAGLKGMAAGAAVVALPGIARAQAEEIVIGAPNSLTGGLGENGQRSTAGMQIAVDQINREGGIKSLGGAKVKLIIADTSSENPTQAASVTRRMIDQEKAVLLLGATTSAMTLAAQVEAEKSEIPLITSSYADGIVTRGYKYTFKITPQGGAVWNWSMSSGYDMWKAAKGSPPKTALIFMSNDAVGLVVQKQLPEHAKTISLEVPFSQSFQMGLSDPSVAVAPVLRYKPDMIFLGGFVNDIILIIKALRGVGVTAPIFGAGPAGSDSVGRGLGAAADGFFAPMAWNWDLTMPGNKEFVEAYRKGYPNAPFPPANEQLGMGYVCALIMAQALEKSASRDPKKIRDVLASAEFTNLPFPNPTVKFGDNGLNVNNKEVLAEWIKGELRTVWPADVQVVKPLL